MTVSLTSDFREFAAPTGCKDAAKTALLGGEILIKTQEHTAWGGSVTASMYLPLSPAEVWQQVTDYPRWVKYFPDLTHSRLLDGHQKTKRIYQVASKTFLFLSVQVEVYLKVLELPYRQIQFCLEKGNFLDFEANLKLQDYGKGTVLTYWVQATPTIPVPSVFIQQAMQMDLPSNMRQMRRVICGG
ncbi:SRPBCC family protein [Ancylothrix sp. C2]|uniref:SRPBCC family protein n=1 Tax=Ancylothrix sp. D3o TaxID=2953691 RepID=UPI0021BB74C1|nr:SRPBCC family protein [Ancylothrix sp. D3o]MCT7950156.1 SRPBCC family protein [Ancylothrix sp. D3o]